MVRYTENHRARQHLWLAVSKGKRPSISCCASLMMPANEESLSLALAIYNSGATNGGRERIFSAIASR